MKNRQQNSCIPSKLSPSSISESILAAFLDYLATYLISIICLHAIAMLRDIELGIRDDPPAAFLDHLYRTCRVHKSAVRPQLH